MNPSYISYDIELSALWEYERQLFLSGKCPDGHAKKVIDNLHPTIAQLSVPMEDSKYGHAYTLKSIEYIVAKKYGIKNIFKLNFFEYGEKIYYYDQSLIITSSNEKFEFCFSLKLRQFNSDCSFVPAFLDFQLKENFNDHAEQLCGFLESNIKHYRDEFYTPELIRAVNQWISSKMTNSNSDNVDQRAKGLKIHPDYHTPVIRSLQPFFEESEYELMSKLIQGEEITGKVYFLSNANRLVMLFRQLHIHQKIANIYVETEAWICRFFQYKNIQKGRSDFAMSDVHKILTTGSYDIPKAKRIEIPGLDFIKEKSKET